MVTVRINARGSIILRFFLGLCVLRREKKKKKRNGKTVIHVKNEKELFICSKTNKSQEVDHSFVPKETARRRKNASQ